VSPPEKITSVKKNSSSLKKHTILLIGDSRARGISERLASYLGPFYHCPGYVKPNADINIITSTGTLEVKTARGLLSIQQFIQKFVHTNVLILNAPVRFDCLCGLVVRVPAYRSR
jgi:hypothetical protein